MKRESIGIEGDTPGHDYGLNVIRFKGSDPSAPRVFIQAAIHADEMPGAAAIHMLLPQLIEIETRKEILGDLIIVPLANPIGTAQRVSHENTGRFDLATSVNFNRDYPLFDAQDGPPIDQANARASNMMLPATERLKAHLLALAFECDVVLDLHCDDQSLNYCYFPEFCWPQAQTLCACLNSEAAILWNDMGDGAFEEAAIYPFVENGKLVNGNHPRLATTVEFRGLADVDTKTAERDAAGLLRYLQAIGCVTGDADNLNWDHDPTLIRHVEMPKAPHGGLVLFDVAPGDQVKEGERIATIIAEPGDIKSASEVLAPQSGLILTRPTARRVRRGDALVKLLGSRPTQNVKSGSLES